VRRDVTGYVDYVSSMNHWAAELGCRPDDIEYYIYEEGRKTRVKTIRNCHSAPLIFPSSSSNRTITWPVTLQGRLGKGQGVNQREFQIRALKKIEKYLPSNNPNNPYCITASNTKGKKNLGKTVECWYKNNRVDGQYHRSLKVGIWIGSDFSHSGGTATDDWKDFIKHFNIASTPSIPAFIDFYQDKIVIR
jgi:hypothetical protein